MSTAVFPTNLKGLGFDFKRSPLWSTTRMASASGKETTIGYWSSPRWQYELVFNFLRDNPTDGELAALRGFFNARQGQFDTWLYLDPDDNSVTGQQIGVANGTTVDFKLVRAMDGFIEPMLAPNVVTAVYVGGVLQDPADYTVNLWGSSKPGVVTFDAAPASGAVTADFSYYFPCRFDDDTMGLSKFLSKIWKAESVKFTTVK